MIVIKKPEQQFEIPVIRQATIAELLQYEAEMAAKQEQGGG